MSSMMKPRSGYTAGGFARNQRSKASGNGSGTGGGRGAIIPGRYDYWSPGPYNLWISLCPEQQFEYDLYDRDEREVVHFNTAYFGYDEHYVGANKQRFYCSAGPHMKDPCYGCSERSRFYARREQVEQETGAIPKSMEYAPISKSRRFVLSMTVLEEMGEYQKIDVRSGKVVMSAKNRPIMIWMPTKVGGKTRKDAPKSKSFGRRFHWSFGPDHRDVLIAENEVLETRCRHCANDLVAVIASCPACSSPYEGFEPIPAEILLEDKRSEHHCTECGFTAPHLEADDYIYECECGNGEPGNLFAFELLVGQTSDEDRTPKIYKIRPRQDYSNIQDWEELILKPLELEKIFAASDLPFQLKQLPPERKKVAVPDAHIRKDDDEGGGTEGLGEGDSSEPIDFNY